MLTAILVGMLLLIKHIVIANIVDFGYSVARDTRSKVWWAGFTLWTALELSASATILPETTDWFLNNFVLFEFLLLAGSTYYERHATIGQELRTHFVWEIFILCLYGIAVVALAT